MRLQLPRTLHNPHAQEDRNRPVPQFARDDENRDLGLVLPRQMQLQQERRHADEAGDRDDEQGGCRFAFDHGVVLRGVVEEGQGLVGWVFD